MKINNKEAAARAQVSKHDAFVVRTLTPSIEQHAIESGVTSDEATLAAFLSLGESLQARGITASFLGAIVRAHALTKKDSLGATV